MKPGGVSAGLRLLAGTVLLRTCRLRACFDRLEEAGQLRLCNAAISPLDGVSESTAHRD